MWSSKILHFRHWLASHPSSVTATRRTRSTSCISQSPTATDTRCQTVSSKRHLKKSLKDANVLLGKTFKSHVQLVSNVETNSFWIVIGLDTRCQTVFRKNPCKVQVRSWVRQFNYMYKRVLILWKGYRYEMLNCLCEVAFDKILERCKCTLG